MFEIIVIVVISALASLWLLHWLTRQVTDDPPPPLPPIPKPPPPSSRPPPVYKPRVWQPPSYVPDQAPCRAASLTPAPASDKKPWESEYTADWRQVSREYRKSKGWTCEGCGVNLSRHRRLLHAHHYSMDKSDNSPANLRAYCVICHSEQPHHDKLRVSIRISGEYDEVISIRHSQGIR